MFDRTYTQHHRTEYKPYVKTVNVEKAPTDDSIRLYQEILEKAYDSVLGSIQVNDNELSFKVVFCEDLFRHKTKALLRLTLNGREFKIKFDLNYEDLVAADQYGKVSKIIKGEIVSFLVEELGEELFRDLSRYRMRQNPRGGLK